MASLRIKKGDTVVVIAGKHKGDSGKVIKTDAENHRVQVEAINMFKRHQKARAAGQVSGIEERTGWIDVSNVAIQHPTKKTSGTRIGYKIIEDKSGAKTKTRVYKANDKEIK